MDIAKTEEGTFSLFFTSANAFFKILITLS